MSTAIFFALMAASSAVVFLKLGLLAALLPAASFASYAAWFAIGPWLSSIISFGLVEGTVKRHSRLHAYGRTDEIAIDIKSLLKKILLRTAFAGGALLFANQFILKVEPIVLLGVVIFALGTNLFAVVASALRALEKLTGFALFSVLRAVFSGVVSVAVAYLFGWSEAFAWESLAVLAVSGLSLVVTFHIIGNISEKPLTTLGPARKISHKSDGLLLFAAFTILLLPMSFDRIVIAKIESSQVAALYTFCGIWFMAAFTITSTYVQKFGPEMIRRLALDESSRPLAQAQLHAVILGVIMGMGTMASMLMINILFFHIYWTKYDLSIVVSLITAAVVSVQLTPIFDWTLIALDGEKQLFICAVIFLAATAAGFALAYFSGSGFVGYASALIAGRVCQLTAQNVAIAMLQKRNVIGDPKVLAT